MESVKEFLTSNKARSIYWQAGNLAVLFLITMITDLNWAYAPIALPILNALTKEINKKYL